MGTIVHPNTLSVSSAQSLYMSLSTPSWCVICLIMSFWLGSICGLSSLWCSGNMIGVIMVCHVACEMSRWWGVCVIKVFHGYRNTHGDRVTGTVQISAYCGIPCTHTAVLWVCMGMVNIIFSLNSLCYTVLHHDATKCGSVTSSLLTTKSLYPLTLTPIPLQKQVSYCSIY